MSHSLVVSIPFYLAGCLQGYSAGAVLLLSIGAIAVRRRRRSFIVSVEALSWPLLGASTLCGLTYAVEFFSPFLNGNRYERWALFSRNSTIYGLFYWLMLFSAMIAPQFLWLRRCRTNPFCSGAISLAILLPANYERFVVLTTSLFQILNPLTNP